MIFENLPIRSLADALAPHMGKPACPGLDDPAVLARARQHAQGSGLWDELATRLAPHEPVLASRYTTYRHYGRTGNRAHGEKFYFGTHDRVVDTATGVWLGHPEADLDELHDLLWAVCEWSNWVIPAHENCAVDLFSSSWGRTLAEIRYLLRDRLEQEVADRLGREIAARILDPIADWRRADMWYTLDMNWNHVCNANVIITAMYLIDDPQALAAFVHPVAQRMTYALRGFADDGGCWEGPGYWSFGFGHYVDAALAFRHRTGGEVNLMAEPNVEAICRYPLASQIDGPVRMRFADGTDGYTPASVALAINRFFDIPDLYATVEPAGEGLRMHSWRDLALYDGQRGDRRAIRRDVILPALGQAKLIAAGAAGDQPTVLAVQAGHNAAPHNHNDIGSFIYYRNGISAVTDPGAPTYTARTFGDQRYQILFTRSLGHAVPLVNGREQPAGPQHRGLLRIEGENGDGLKVAEVDMSAAYDDPSLTKLLRRLELSPDGALTLTDAYAFTQTPASLEEAFVTYEPVEVAADGRSARIGTGASAVRLAAAAGSAGRFAACEMVEESKEGRTGGVITRITFAPAELATEMSLAFELA